MTDPSFPTNATASQSMGPASRPTAAAPTRPDPPSVRLVLGALQDGGRLTGAELRAASGLPRRTVYQALRVLRERGDVQFRKSLQDTRQSYFWLSEPVAANVEAPEGLHLDGTGTAQPDVSAT